MSERPPEIEEEPGSLEPQPATGGAGRRGPPTAVGAGFGDESGDESLPPLSPGTYNRPIEDLDLSMRSYNCLRRSGFMVIGQVLEKSEEQLLTLRNFNHKCYTELREKLDEQGILPLSLPTAPTDKPLNSPLGGPTGGSAWPP